jgi:hypothetical protein
MMDIWTCMYVCMDPPVLHAEMRAVAPDSVWRLTGAPSASISTMAFMSALLIARSRPASTMTLRGVCVSNI